MRLLTLAAVLAAPLTLPAKTLRGIPGEVDAALHISYDVAAKSQLHPVTLELQQRMEKLSAELDPATAARNKQLMERLGLKKDGIHTFDLGVRVTKAAPEVAEPGFNLYGVMRLEMKKAAMDAFAKAEGVAPVVMNGTNGWEFSKLSGAFLKALGAEEQADAIGTILQDYAVVMPEDGVVIFCPVREMPKALACWNGKTPSHELAPAAKSLVAETPLAHTQMHAKVRSMMETLDPEAAKTDTVGLKDVSATVGEDTKDFLIRAKASFLSEAKATTAVQQISAGIAIGTMASQVTEEDDADTKYLKGEAAAFLAGITVKQEADTVILRSAFPIARMKTLLQNFGQKIEQTIRETASVQKEGDVDEAMDAPVPAKTK